MSFYKIILFEYYFATIDGKVNIYFFDFDLLFDDVFLDVDIF